MRLYSPKVHSYLLAFISMVVLTLSFNAHAERAPWRRSGRKVKVKIDSVPRGASVYIDDKKWGVAGTTPTKWIRLPRNNSYKIILTHPDMQDFETTIQLTRKYRNKFSFTMKRKIFPGVLEFKAADTSAAGAEIHIDGVQKGTIPSKITLKPGKYQIKVTKQGFKDYTELREVAEKSTVSLFIKLTKVETPKGAILVTSDMDGSEVYMDNKLVGTTPKLINNVVPGNHLIVVKNGDNKMQKIVEVKANDTAKVLAKIKPKSVDVPEGLVTVITDIAGCDVYIDGILKGKTPMPRLKVMAGQHMVEVRKKDYISQKRTITVVAKQQQLVDFTMKIAPKHVPVGPLKITTETGAQIFIDGQPKGKSSVQYDSMKAGTYQVEIVKPGYKKVQKTIEVKAKTGAVIHIPLERVGTIKVTANVIGASIIVDNREIGKVPLLNYELPVGTYRLEIRARDYRPYTRTIAIKGGTTEPVTLNVNLLPLGPTPEEIAAMKSSLSAFGAKVIPQRSFIAAAGIDWPYWFEGKLMVGIWRKGNIAVDGGATLRTYFSMTEFLFNTRVQLFQGGPLTAGVFMDIGGGIGKEERVNFTWNIGGAGTLSFREKVNLNLSAYFNIYRDRFCLTSEPGTDDPQSEPGFCATADPQDQIEGWKGHNLRDPYWGVRLMFQASVEWAINTKYSVYAKLKWAAAGLNPSGTAYRPAYMDYYYSGSFEKAIIPKVDPTFYGGAGFIWKF